MERECETLLIIWLKANPSPGSQPFNVLSFRPEFVSQVIYFYATDMPLGQMPVLEYDGTQISQSLTIARFLAKEFGLAGKNNLEQAQADMIIDAGSDLANSEFY